MDSDQTNVQTKEQAFKEAADAVAQGKGLWLDYYAASEGKPVARTNMMIVQRQDEEMFVSFFAVSPPVTFGPPELQARQIKGVEAIIPECVGRFAITPKFAREMIDALEGQLKTETTEKQQKSNELANR